MKQPMKILIPTLLLLSAFTMYSQHKEFATAWLQSNAVCSHATMLVLLLVFFGLVLGMTYVLHLEAKKQKEICQLKTVKVELERLLDKKEKLMEENRQEIVRLNNKNSRTHRTLKEETDRLQKQIETLREQLSEKDVVETVKDPQAQQYIETFKKKFGGYHKDYLPPTQKEWDDLEKAFRSDHSAYYHFISSHLKMKKSHIYVCMMIRLGITEQMMSFALETDNRRIDRLKRQANRMMFGENNAKTLRENFLRHFLQKNV